MGRRNLDFCNDIEFLQMPALLDTVDPDGLLEYSVVFTDRSLNYTKFKNAATKKLSLILDNKLCIIQTTAGFIKRY